VGISKMRFEFTFKSVVRFWCLGLAIMFYLLVWAACQTTPNAEFSKIKMSMTKDDVLEIVGSPQRTERINGKDKWAYHIFKGNNPTTESFMQVTFLNGHVVSAGEDIEEIKRLAEIAAVDEKNEKAQKEFKEKQAALKASEKTSKASTPEVIEDEPKTAIEEDFVEIKGHIGPIKKTDSDD
jgi:outer membrane protein assembly factor BamE